MKAFIVNDSFVRTLDGDIVNGQVAYDEKGQVITDSVGGRVSAAEVAMLTRQMRRDLWSRL